MASKYDERFKAQVIADRVLLGSDRAVARKHGISCHTVKRWCEADTELAQKCAQKKDEVAADILAHMETKKDVVNQIIDRYLAALLDEDKINSATTNQLTTALGTLIDKFTGMRTNFAAGQSCEDDALSASLKEMAQSMMEERNAGKQ